MIGGVSKVVIGVEDQERAKAFWVETLILLAKSGLGAWDSSGLPGVGGGTGGAPG